MVDILGQFPYKITRKDILEDKIKIDPRNYRFTGIINI